VEDETKDRFDKAQVQVSSIQGKMATQDDTLKALLDKWEAK
jgi:hypothetical protein